MSCPHGTATATVEQRRRTALGYRACRCQRCRPVFNERTGTPFNHLQYPTDLVRRVVLRRLRDKLSLRDLAELFLARGFAFGHEAVRDWEARFAPLLVARPRVKRRGQAGVKWHADETYVRVGGRWCSLYRAIDRDGTLVDVLLSGKRDMAAARRFFTRARATVGHVPEQVATGGHDADSHAIRETLGDDVTHRTGRDKNNRIEHDHRSIKQRYYPMRGCGAFASAGRFCVSFEGQRQYCRAQVRSGERVSLAERRHRFLDRRAAVMAELATV